MPTEPFVNWESTKLRVANSLHKPAAELSPEWDSLCSQATKDACVEIKRIFVLKGFTVAQLVASSDTRVWAERLAAFWAMVRGTALASYSLDSVKYLDCREELENAGAIIIGDVAVTPGGTDIGGISHGRVTAADCDAERFGRW